jgi:hypothetical protein
VQSRALDQEAFLLVPEEQDRRAVLERADVAGNVPTVLEQILDRIFGLGAPAPSGTVPTGRSEQRDEWRLSCDYLKTYGPSLETE